MGTGLDSRRTAGLLFGVASSVCFSASGTFAKALTDAGFSALQAVWVRIAGACVILLAVTVLLRGPDAFRALLSSGAAIRGVLLFGLVAVAICQAMYFVAASRLPVGVAILLEYAGPALVVIYQRLVLRRTVRRTAFLGIAMAMLGLCGVVEIWSGVSLDALGLACGVGTAVGNAAYFLILDRLTGTADPLTISAGGMLVATVLLVPVALPWNTPWHKLGSAVALAHFSVPGWSVALALVLFSTVISYVLGGMAVQRLSAPVAAALAYVEPISACVLAWVLLGQSLSSVQIV
ncbi:MAG TPA: EamA family transporter, partial [Actinospica sp.]|nr:EamA family transporter [Actinospica sp.]